jgi:CheY-like chemotaxis protein
VAGDAARLQQIIWNLLSNAVKFTSRDGWVYVSLRRNASSAELEVRDTGMGIEVDFLPRVFERFRQAESPVTRSHRGLGLGLAIVRHLTELHGGTVTAESPGAGQGATFTIRIPLAAMQAESASLASAQIEHEETPPNRQPLEGVRVLIVEDETDARELLTLTLECSGARVEAVESAQEALDNLQHFRPHVLLSDIGLPVESGYELIRKVRLLSSEASRLPAVALTAFATEKDRQLALSAGFQVHLSKPVDPDVLIEAIDRLANSNNNSEKL